MHSWGHIVLHTLHSFMICGWFCPRADHALTTVAMRKFCEDKISSSLQPSQNRFLTSLKPDTHNWHHHNITFYPKNIFIIMKPIPVPHRYIYYFSGLLSGAIKINSSSLLLHQVHIPFITNYEPGEGTHPLWINIWINIISILKYAFTWKIYTFLDYYRILADY